MTRLYIFDADNTLRRTTVPGQVCPHASGEWELLPGVRERLARIDWAQAALGVASNQDHVGYGLLSRAQCRALLHELVSQATGGRARNVRVLFCHHVLEVTCACRKPAPGMLKELLASFRVRPEEALFVGDAVTDEAAALAAGIPFQYAAAFFGSTPAAPTGLRG
ncbi:MAG: HAD-IIIA family hydrolase [Myxococcaceae bacterium]